MKTIILYFLLILIFICESTNAAVVLIYHHVSNTTPKSTSISPEDFEAHLNYLETNEFTVIPLIELVELIRQNKPLPDKTVAITFDDAYRDVYESAYPILKKRNWPFTFFVNTDSVGKGKLFVTWDQLREMSKNGVTIANHSTSHNHMVRRNTEESVKDWRIRVEREISLAQDNIKQEIGFAPKIFAYPYGEYNSELKSILEKLGYISFTQQAGALSLIADKQILPRFPFGGSYTKLDDFILKANSVALPVTSIKFFTADRKPLITNSVKAGDKPFFEMQLSDELLIKKVNCYLNGEPMAIEAKEQSIKIAFKKPLEQGRTKVTCTAPSGIKGRHYWFTQLWLATDKHGEWKYTD
ncbi:MAG: polysaccharide deacetylase family protein [Cellvibrio sp.]|nr:polysaccharide deacetylase family protein [Cellvibrio sp.]